MNAAMCVVHRCSSGEGSGAGVLRGWSSGAAHDRVATHHMTLMMGGWENKKNIEQ